MPIVGYPSTEAWQVDNSMVLAWLINLMEAKVSQNFILCDIVKQLWNTINLMNSNLNNDSQLYDLRRFMRLNRQVSRLHLILPS